MSDRTVAEVMGWDVHNPHRFPSTPPPDNYLAWKCAECGEWVDDGKPRTECSSSWNQHPKPTPDDMLSWLYAALNDVELEVHGWRDVDGQEVCRVTLHSDAYPPREFTRSTLHAALEAAVLAVSAAQDVEQQGDDGEDDENGGQHG